MVDEQKRVDDKKGTKDWWRLWMLLKFGVCGFEKAADFHKIKQMLWDNDIEHDYKKETLIWLPTFNKGIVELIIKNG